MFLRELLVCVCAVVVVTAQGQSRLVTIAQGPVRGYKAPDGHYEFLGIPYATQPTGPQKFRPPLPPPTWTQPFEATQSFVVCPQFIFAAVVSEEGNCLITNVYVPDTEEKNLPVIVHFHGGAFKLGFGSMWTAKKIVTTYNAIVVNFNYRLGAQGFLCLGTKDIPGNAAMKDQVALLRWVQQNIGSFGGNPNDVTIYGWSAGAASADLVSISKMSRGLFHKVIVDSGSSTASFSVQVDPTENAKNIAKYMNFNDVDNLEALEAFYKNASNKELASLNFPSSPNASTIFAPCIERDIGEEIFLDDAPVNILKSGDVPKVPILIGIAEMEGIFRLGSFETWQHSMNAQFSDFLPEDLAFPTEIEKHVMVQRIKRLYFGNKPVNANSILGYVNYFTDAMFGYGAAKAAKLRVEAGNKEVYLYEYAFTDERDSYIPYTNIRGATHCAKSDSVLDEGNEDQFLPGRKNMKATMRDIHNNFIKTGRPVPANSPHPAWPPVLFRRTPYMSLNSTLTLRASFLKYRDVLWDQIYSKYYRTPVAPYS